MAKWAKYVHSTMQMVSYLRNRNVSQRSTTSSSSSPSTEITGSSSLVSSSSGTYKGRWLNLLNNKSKSDLVNAKTSKSSYPQSVATVFTDKSRNVVYDGRQLIDLNTSTNNHKIDNGTHIHSKSSSSRRRRRQSSSILVSADDFKARRDLLQLLDLLLIYVRLKKEEEYLQQLESKLIKRRARMQPQSSLLSTSINVLSSIWPLATADVILRRFYPGLIPQRFDYPYLSPENVDVALILSLLINGISLLLLSPSAVSSEEKKRKIQQDSESLKQLHRTSSQLAKMIKLSQNARVSLVSELKSLHDISEFDMEEYLRCLEVSVANYSYHNDMMAITEDQQVSKQQNNQKSSSSSLRWGYTQPQSLEQWLESTSKKYTNSMPGELSNVSSQLLRSTGMLLANLDYVKDEIETPCRLLPDNLYKDIEVEGLS